MLLFSKFYAERRVINKGSTGKLFSYSYQNPHENTKVTMPVPGV